MGSSCRMWTLFDKRSREAVLMGFGLATAQAERIIAGGRTLEVTRVRITEAGRGALAQMKR
jgi:hypothetical protein